MESNKKLTLSIAQKLIAVLPPAAFIVSLIFLFGPFNIYKGNISEFSVSLTSVLGFYLVPALVLLLVLSGIGLILPTNLHRRYVVVLFVIGILIWLQGNILVWKYGLLDGHVFDWTKDQWRGWADGAVWVALLTGGLLFYQRVYKIAALCCILLFSLQLASLGYMSFQRIELWDAKAKVSIPTLPTDEIYQFSSSKNVIHVILDQFQSDIFEEIVKEDADFYFKKFEGFTFFRETIGSFPTTYLSIPTILSGQKYRNNMPLSSFMAASFKGKTIPNVLYDNGYEVDLAHAFPTYKEGSYSNYYHIPVPYGLTKDQYVKASGAFLIDLVLFRSTPHFLKKFVCNDQQWLVQRLLFTQLRLLKGGKEAGKVAMGYFAHSRFLDDMIDSTRVKRNKPVYKFIHLITSHGPFVVNKDCQYAGKALPNTRENIRIQQKCALDHFMKFLDKLKTIGVYRSSLIIVNADHGAGIDVKMTGNGANLQGGSSELNRIAGAALPLMLIKPPNSKGLLNFSDVPAMLSDIPATLSSILNLKEDFPGISIFQIDPNKVRERRFYMYKWRNENWKDDFVDRMDEYIIIGSVFDKASWRKGVTYFPPDINAYEIQKIDFGTAEATKFRRSGWGGDERSANGDYTFNWSLGRSASISISLPNDKPVMLTANILSYPFDKPQHVTIKVDGKEIGSWELRSPWCISKHSIVIGPKEDRPDVSIIEFVFAHHRIPKGKERPVAVRFESITLSGAKSLK